MKFVFAIAKLLHIAEGAKIYFNGYFGYTAGGKPIIRNFRTDIKKTDVDMLPQWGSSYIISSFISEEEAVEEIEYLLKLKPTYCFSIEKIYCK